MHEIDTDTVNMSHQRSANTFRNHIPTAFKGIGHPKMTIRSLFTHKIRRVQWLICDYKLFLISDQEWRMNGYCSPDTHAVVLYVPSCCPLSEQCHVKLLSWPVLRIHSISKTKSTTVTPPWWANTNKRQDTMSKAGRDHFSTFKSTTN